MPWLFYPPPVSSHIPEDATHICGGPGDHAFIHIIRSGYDCNLPENVPQVSFRFDKVYPVLYLSGNRFIELVGGGKGWGFVELYEEGDGKWKRGQVVDHGDNETANKSLAAYGFARGKPTEPVWLCLRQL
jgi:hypothetical protein